MKADAAPNPIPQDDVARCGLSWAAKVVCSGVFITGRDPGETFRASCAWMAASEEILQEATENRNVAALMNLPVTIEVDHERRGVRLELDGVDAYAFYHADQGSVVSSKPHPELAFAPQKLKRNPEAGVFSGSVEDPDPIFQPALTRAFKNSFQFTNALVVAHRGEIVAEAYADGYDENSRFEAWSMGKSLAATLVGLTHQQGLIDLDEPAGFAAWQAPTDPRRDIRVRDLLNMASGLEFTGSYGRSEDHTVKAENGLCLDHTYVYAGGVDSFEFSVSKPLAHAPGTNGRYRNCDPLLAVGLVRERAAGGDVKEFLHWPQRHLFNPLGCTDMVLETDPFGHFLISGHDYGTARDWARLGQLYLNRGYWQGNQLLAPEFVDFVQTPAEKAWHHDPYYGGFFCTNATGIIPTLPNDAFWMSGGGRQRVMIVPSLDLVVVRMGHIAGFVFDLDNTLNEVYREIAEAVAA
ncbi:MAG: serine hydrolase [Pseudomonadota bacterium]